MIKNNLLASKLINLYNYTVIYRIVSQFGMSHLRNLVYMAVARHAARNLHNAIAKLFTFVIAVLVRARVCKT